MFSLKVMGVLALDSDTGAVPPAARQKRRLGLIALLAVAGPRGMSRDKVQAYLWAESSSANARHALDQLLYATRHALGANPFVSMGGELQLDASVVRSDVSEFTAAIKANSWSDAVALYTGPLLDGVHLSHAGDVDSWIDGERATLQRDYQRALETLARATAAAGDFVAAVAWWRKLALSDPLSSRVATETVRALASASEHAAAIQHARAFERRVRSELGVEPDPAIRKLLAGLAPPAVTTAPPATDAPRLTSLAVLPFIVLSEVENSRALSLGFADALITIFGNLDDIAVAPTSAILNYAADADPAQVCRDLDVGHALQGTVQKLGARWRVSTHLFDAARRKITLSEKHDFTLDSMFEVQDEIGRRVVESLQRRFPRTVPTSRERYTADREAYFEFMTGLSESVSDAQATLRSAAAHLTRAVERDPEFALAHATLSFVLMDMHNTWDPQRVWLSEAEDHCRRALELDPVLAEGYLARAWILWSPARNFQHIEAIAALEQVLALRPNLERAHNRMSGICAHIGRLAEARVAHEKARCVNPKTRSGNLEWIHILSGDFVSAEASAEAWFRERPNNLYAVYTRVLPPLLSGNLKLAEQRLAVALKRAPGDPLIVSAKGMLHARRGETEAALSCARSAFESPRSFGHTHHTTYQIACIYAVLGETESALGWLERSTSSGFACWSFLRLDPYLENLRANPAFIRLIEALERTYSTFTIAAL